MQRSGSEKVLEWEMRGEGEEKDRTGRDAKVEVRTFGRQEIKGMEGGEGKKRRR